MNLPEFRNLPLTDFSQPDTLAAMRQSLCLVRGQLGREYDLIIGSSRTKRPEKFESLNPSRNQEVVGVFQKAGVEQVEAAMRAALQAFELWGRIDAEHRIEAVLKISRRMQERRLELASWMVIEVGKSWAEADADVAEAVDFCEFYAREMSRLSGPQPLVRIEGERNELYYLPLGVGVIIPPWNFPLAILTGMTIAAVVAGNTVIVKPASDSPTIAAKLMEIVEEAGLPSGVINFLTGEGSEVGEALVNHPKTRFVAFTGSKEVGLRINRNAAETRPGQIWIKRVVAEMGGKDAILVDEECDLDEAAAGVTVSAFGYQGQKCSACSRAIVVSSVYDPFLERLQGQVETSIRIGNVEEPDVNFGPVISRRAFHSILDYIEVGRNEGRLILGGEAGDSSGHFIQPTVFADVDPRARIAQEEIFGPVLAVIRARDFDHALQVANDSEYGLTGAVYTRHPTRLDQARREFHVGNLYLNRKCTGAFVGVHPFGGFNMSGTNSKAGGRDYLLLFTQAKVVAAKID